MNILWHTWEPGLMDPTPTSAGGAQWTRYLWDRFIIDGSHRIFWGGLRGFPMDTSPLVELEQIDIAFFCWRWPMPQHPERHEAYMRQMELIAECNDLHIPVVVHDQDHKMTENDVKWLLDAGAILTTPELRPRPSFRSLLFPSLPPAFNIHLRRFPGLSKHKLVYVGNNYERFDQAVEFFGPLSRQMSVLVHGNWLEASTTRERPEEVLRRLPHVYFAPRLPQDKVIETLASADFTIHLFKESYGPTGFTTIRWAEAAWASTPAFIPYDFFLPATWAEAFAPMIVRDGVDLLNRVSGFTFKSWLDVRDAQQQFVYEKMTPQPWLELVEELV